MANILAQRLQAGVLVFDGAMGTELYKRNFFINTCFEQLCATNPEAVAGIHAAYADAGADVLTTNSFGANRNKLARFGLADKVAEINAAAVRVARRTAGAGRLVAGSVGPVGDIPFKSLDDGELVDILREHGAALREAGADFLIFETLTSLRELSLALQAAAALDGVPFMVSLALSRDGETATGEPAEAVVAAVEAAPARPSALGLNCGVGPEAMLGIVERVSRCASLPIVAQPNAGVPRSVDNRTIYMTSPEYLTTYAVRYVNLGAHGVGGCCGTGPEHIADLARSVKPMAKKSFTVRQVEVKKDVALKEPAPMASKSALGRKLAAKEWVRTVEVVPPRGWDISDTVAKAARCAAGGIDAINIPDGPRASSRMSPLVTAIAIQEKAGIEAILHFCCRDRSLIGMQSDLLGSAAAGVRNILFITGDPPKLGDYPFSSAVFDADSVGVVGIQAMLNRGVDIGGQPIAPPTSALIGVGADPNAIDMERELRRMREKAEAGAEFVITQPVFDPVPLLRFMDAIEGLGLPVIAGIWPLASYRNAEFMRNEVPGVVVPDAVMERMARHKDKEDQRKEGVAIARESVEAIRGRMAGVQVSAPFGRVDTALEVAAP